MDEQGDDRRGESRWTMDEERTGGRLRMTEQRDDGKAGR